MNNQDKQRLIGQTAMHLGIDSKEAEKRLDLLQQSGILEEGDPSDPHTQHLIDSFLSHTSEELVVKMAFDHALHEALEDKNFVRQFDRLSGCDLTGVLADAEKGKERKNAKEVITKFTFFFKKSVWDRAAQAQ